MHGAVHEVLLREFDKLGVEFGGQHRVVADIRVGLDRWAVVILEVVVDSLGAVEPAQMPSLKVRKAAAYSTSSSRVRRLAGEVKTMPARISMQ